MNNKPTMKEYSDGTKEWWLNGALHREDGPAGEYPSGSKRWYLNGLLYREDGPAVEWANGEKFWWLNSQDYEYTKGKLHNNNFLTSDQYTGPIIIMGGKNKIRFMKATNNKHYVIKGY
jgi:hypothetical protein